MNESKNKLIPLLLIFLGEILIVSAFYLLIPEVFWNKGFYLNMIATSIVYLFNILTIFNLFPSTDNFNKKIAGLGILMFFDIIYTLLAVSIIVVGMFSLIPFNLQLILHSGLLFGLAIILFISNGSSDYAQTVYQSEKTIRNGILNLRTAISEVEFSYNTAKLDWQSEGKTIYEIKEIARYLSPIQNEAAELLELKIIAEFKNLIEEFSHNIPDRQIVKDKLMQCNILLNKRKQFYNN